MICPLKNLAHLINPNANRIYDEDCNPECAWWDGKKGQCCIKTLSNLKITGGVNIHPN